MSRVTRILPLVLLLAAACSSATIEEGPPAEAAPPETTTEAVTTTEKPPRWRGNKAKAYRNSYRICSAFTVKEVARQHGVRRTVFKAARAHAKALYRKKYFKPAFEGCRDAFRGRSRRA